ncbi:N-acetylmuramoyl-L-alanine amidase [Micromonospora kangleipakensis]|uniref:N-acetylmuramoyl-L-alanine amidase n=1 Tax=Micromonospora kangleipakensis TaxID=1077942 RepID=A0A4Q8B914_9ACTN|nr:N-acetylmuramoyl-L-alanine amidase [Micromonospora kangleipakensis]RZU74200.1 N-acetylmuramoyl-L-alanine amidase [Micromonospora kangleipakensis]
MKLTGIRWNRRTAGITAAMVATAVAGTASLAAAGYGEDLAVWGAGDGPVAAALHTVAFPAANGREVTIPRRDTERFAMVGVTWTDPQVDFKGTIDVRTHAVDGKWSGWRPLELDNHFGPEPGAEKTAGKARGSTDPLWVGLSDGVEVRATAAAGGTSDRLPAGLRLELVDPGQTKRRKAGAAGVGQLRPERLQPVAEVRALEPTPTDPAPTETAPTDPADPPTTTAPAETTAPAPTETTAPPATTTAPAPTTTSAPAPTTAAPTVAPTATAPANPVPTPKVVTRAEWKADESIVTEPPTYGATVKAFFVHHTAGTNDYSCADSAAIVRGIEVYHVKSNGWNDIGYNFLVDKCGVVFEGRKGGIDKPVTGAHTYGFNTDNAAIAVLGTYISTGIPTVVQDAVAHVAAYKLGQYGNDPLGKVTLTSGVDGKYDLGEQVVFNRISGHRDAVATECPGDALYGQLSVLRNKAASVYGLTLTGLTGTKNGTTYYTGTTTTASWAVSTPSALISRFEVLVDGAVVATTAGTARSAALTLAQGTHTVQVRGVHRLGRTAATPAQTIVADTTAPTFPQGPTLSLRTGGVSSTVVPVTLNWRSADNVAVRSVALTAPTTGTFAASGAYGTTTKPGVTTTWSMRAQDWSGNTATSSASWTPVFIPESKATRTGTWGTYTSSNYLGGSALTATAGGASLSWVFTGRSVSFVATKTSTSGQAHIYVDGVKVSTVDLYSSTVKFRQVVWAKSWTGSGRHTVKIVVAGTSGRPRIITDGLVYVR